MESDENNSYVNKDLSGKECKDSSNDERYKSETNSSDGERQPPYEICKRDSKKEGMSSAADIEQSCTNKITGRNTKRQIESDLDSDSEMDVPLSLLAKNKSKFEHEGKLTQKNKKTSRVTRNKRKVSPVDSSSDTDDSDSICEKNLTQKYRIKTNTSKISNLNSDTDSNPQRNLLSDREIDDEKGRDRKKCNRKSVEKCTKKSYKIKHHEYKNEDVTDNIASDEKMLARKGDGDQYENIMKQISIKKSNAKSDKNEQNESKNKIVLDSDKNQLLEISSSESSGDERVSEQVSNSDGEAEAQKDSESNGCKDSVEKRKAERKQQQKGVDNFSVNFGKTVQKNHENKPVPDSDSESKETNSSDSSEIPVSKKKVKEKLESELDLNLKLNSSSSEGDCVVEKCASKLKQKRILINKSNLNSNRKKIKMHESDVSDFNSESKENNSLNGNSLSELKRVTVISKKSRVKSESKLDKKRNGLCVNEKSRKHCGSSDKHDNSLKRNLSKKHRSGSESKLSKSSSGTESDDDRSLCRATGKRSDRKNKSNKDPFARYKKYLKAMNLKISNYEKFFEGYKTIKAKKERLVSYMQQHGLKGNPTMEACKKVGKKILIRQEAAELDVDNVICDTGRGRRRNVWSVYQSVSPQSSSSKEKRRMSRIALQASDSSDDERSLVECFVKLEKNFSGREDSSFCKSGRNGSKTEGRRINDVSDTNDECEPDDHGFNTSVPRKVKKNLISVGENKSDIAINECTVNSEGVTENLVNYRKENLSDDSRENKQEFEPVKIGYESVLNARSYDKQKDKLNDGGGEEVSGEVNLISARQKSPTEVMQQEIVNNCESELTSRKRMLPCIDSDEESSVLTKSKRLRVIESDDESEDKKREIVTTNNEEE